MYFIEISSLQWRHNDRDGVSNHQPHVRLLNRLFRGRSKKTSKLRVTGLCAGNSPVTGEFPAQKASNAENVSIWWRQKTTFEIILIEIRFCCYNWLQIGVDSGNDLAPNGLTRGHYLDQWLSCARPGTQTSSDTIKLMNVQHSSLSTL